MPGSNGVLTLISEVITREIEAGVHHAPAGRIPSALIFLCELHPNIPTGYVALNYLLGRMRYGFLVVISEFRSVEPPEIQNQSHPGARRESNVLRSHTILST
jgi:hypothetical protein